MTGDKEALKLRKAKADGVRLAAKMWQNPIYQAFKQELLDLADKIERGEA